MNIPTESQTQYWTELVLRNDSTAFKSELPNLIATIGLGGLFAIVVDYFNNK